MGGDVRREDGRRVPPWLIQACGIVLLIGAGVFWGITGRESVLIMSAALSLIFLGVYDGAMSAFKRRNE